MCTLRRSGTPSYVADGGFDFRRNRTTVVRASDDPLLDVLVRCAQAGDPQAFHEVAESFAPCLARYIGTMIRDNASADDVVQETLLAAWHHIDKVNGGAHLRPWLYRVARNKALTLIRHRRTRGLSVTTVRVGPSSTDGLTGDEDGGTTHDVPDPAPPRAPKTPTDLDRALQLAIARLPGRFAGAVRLHYVHGRTTGEIAALVGVSRSTVKMRLLRARQLLADLLPETVETVGGRARSELNDWVDRSHAVSKARRLTPDHTTPDHTTPDHTTPENTTTQLKTERERPGGRHETSDTSVPRP